MAKETINPLAWKGYFERFALPLLQRDRFFIGMVLALIIVAIQSAALIMLLPLHRVEPYIVKINNSGQVVSSGEIASQGKPAKAEITYWLGQFVTDLYTVEPGAVKRNVSQAYYMTQGAAVQQFSRFMKKHNPVHQLANNPSLRTTVKINGVSVIAKNTAYVTASITNQLTGNKRSIAITVSYVSKPPKKVAAALRNPIGMHITNFVAQGNS